MDAHEFLQCASKLLAIGTPSANRSAVSRAYYGAFHVAKALLEAYGFRFPYSDRSHGEVKRLLLWSDDKQVTDAASLLSDLRTMRNRADYELTNLRYETAKHTSYWIGIASGCINALDDAFSG